MGNCKFCNRLIENSGSLKAHELCCNFNPDKIKYSRSAEAGAKKGCVPWNKGKILKAEEIPNYKNSIEEVMTKNSKYSRHCLRTRIIKHNIIEYKCAICGIEPMWKGKPMPLILDHINGINNDNRLKNLRFICSNCDSQLPTYKARNRK